MNPEPKYPDVTVQLSGRDSNAGFIMGNVTTELRRYLRARMEPRAVEAEMDEFRAEAYGGDYDHLLRTCMSWVSVE